MPPAHVVTRAECSHLAHSRLSAGAGSDGSRPGSAGTIRQEGLYTASGRRTKLSPNTEEHITNKPIRGGRGEQAKEAPRKARTWGP